MYSLDRGHARGDYGAHVSTICSKRKTLSANVDTTQSCTRIARRCSASRAADHLFPLDTASSRRPSTSCGPSCPNSWRWSSTPGKKWPTCTFLSSAPCRQVIRCEFLDAILDKSHRLSAHPHDANRSYLDTLSFPMSIVRKYSISVNVVLFSTLALHRQPVSSMQRACFGSYQLLSTVVTIQIW